MVKRLLPVALVLLTTSQVGFADVVVTRSHKRYTGTLANRAAFAKNPTGANSVSLIMDRDGADSLSVQSFPLSKIESVVLEDGTDKRVFDVVTLHRLQSLRAKAPRRTRVLPPTDTSAVAFGPTSARTTGKGTSMLSLQVGQGEGNFAGLPGYSIPEWDFVWDNTPNEPDYLYLGGPQHQLQFGAEYWYMCSEDYAVTGAFALGMSSGKQQVANLTSDDVASDYPDLKFTSGSTRFRIGFDRVGNAGNRFVWFMGPGFEYWSGRTKTSLQYFTQSVSADTILTSLATVHGIETPRVTRFGFNGRVGGTMMLNSRFGITGRIGHTFGRASVEDRGGRTTGLSGTREAMWGLTFAFRTVPTQAP